MGKLGRQSGENTVEENNTDVYKALGELGWLSSF